MRSRISAISRVIVIECNDFTDHFVAAAREKIRLLAVENAAQHEAPCDAGIGHQGLQDRCRVGQPARFDHDAIERRAPARITPLQQVLQSVEGPVAKILAVIIIITTGLTLAFGESSGGFRRLIQIVFGLSIAFAASSFFLSFFSFGGGALI